MKHRKGPMKDQSRGGKKWGATPAKKRSRQTAKGGGRERGGGTGEKKTKRGKREVKIKPKGSEVGRERGDQPEGGKKQTKGTT